MTKGIIKIKTIGKVIPKFESNFEMGLKYSIPYNSLGLPYFSAYDYFPKGSFSKISIARLERYDALVIAINTVKSKLNLQPKQVLSLFSEICVIKETNERARAIKEGVTFVIEVETENKQFFIDGIRDIHNLGYINDEITGEVEISAQWFEDENENVKENTLLLKDTDFSRIDYRFEIESPLCIFSPFTTCKTKNYVPGEIIYNLIKSGLKNSFDDLNTDGFICTNAYPSYRGRRTVPAPFSLVVEKLNRNQLQYKLATVPKTIKQVQTVNLTGDYIINIDDNITNRLSIDTEKISVLSDKDNSGDITYEAIRTGYEFSGSIYGNDEIIRKAYDYINSNKDCYIGDFTDEGYGKIKFTYLYAKEKRNEPECYYKAFDLFINSDLKLYNSNGLYAYDSDILLEKIEKILNQEGQLEYVSKHMNPTVIYQNKAEEMCISKGSSFRMKRKDDKPINVSPLIRNFIGEDTKFGFGEIRTYPPYDQYYKYSKDVEVDKFTNVKYNDIKDISVCANLIDDILKEEVIREIKKLALIDRDSKIEVASEEKEKMLFAINDFFGGYLSEEKILEIYREIYNYEN